ncbi:hypothetical protein E4U21_006791 [Claviceps maximensis]|nr:hypothetical protein E4U21_006791 [Claviceps maximensis]
MKYEAHDSSAVVANPIPRIAPYSSTLSYAASSSSASSWSDIASQSSDDTSISANTSDFDSCDSLRLSRRAATTEDAADSCLSFNPRETDTVFPVELRRNPRRSAPGSHPGRSVLPPTLVRQLDRKLNFVDSLVDTATRLVTAFWPLSSSPCGTEPSGRVILPLRMFIQETLRRSRTSYSTLQVALYYLVLIRPHVPKPNSTAEQQQHGDRHADRALHCGRRMFLAALILACKYLQDRNYSARAWSKISGLNTQEINQNELAFLFAVKWKLHITEDAFQRFTLLVHKPWSHPQQHTDWKELALKLESNITDHETLFCIPPTSTSTSDLCALSPRSILNLPHDGRDVRGPTSLSTSTSTSTAPDNFTAATSLSHPPGHNLLFTGPTPSHAINPSVRAVAPVSTSRFLPSPRPTTPSPLRVTTNITELCTPAVSATSRILGKSSAMGLAMAQASSVGTSQTSLDRFPSSSSVSSSLGVYCLARRTSLANSISTASSPESMVPDSLRSSRSSSISSASSLASATLYNNNRSSVPLRSRVWKLWDERLSSNTPSVPSVPEDVDEDCMALSSPELYHESETKLGDLTLNAPPVTRVLSVRDLVVCDAAADAAKALQDLHNHEPSCDAISTAALTSRKRNRATSVDISNNHLHDHVREILIRRCDPAESSWSNTMPTTRLRSMHSATCHTSLQASSHGAFGHGVKRVCC